MLRDMQCHVVQTGVSISDVHGHGKSSCRELFGLVLAAALMLPSLGLSQVTVSTLSSADVAGRLQGKSGSNRAAEIAAIAPLLKAGLAAQEAADILGSATDLSESSRAAAIQSIARAKKIGPGLSEGELVPVLAGMTGSSRALALSELVALTPASVGTMQSSPPPSSSGVPIGGLPFPSSTAGTTPTSIGGATLPAPAEPLTCLQPIDTERKFCNLMRAVVLELAKAGANEAKSLAFRKVFEELFKSLPRRVQLSLFSRGFLKEEFATQPFKKSAMEYINSPSAVPLFLVGVFADAVREAYGDWAKANYQDSPWTYAIVQGYGDQMYVGLLATLTAIAKGQSEAGLWEALILESEITATRLYEVGQYSFLLSKERKSAVASIAQLILSASSASFARQQGFLPPASRVHAFDETAVASSVRQTVISSDIPSFDRVARLIYQARMAKLASYNQSTTFYRTQSLAALALADDLDRQRPPGVKYWITAFGSYKETTTTILTALNLPLS